MNYFKFYTTESRVVINIQQKYDIFVLAYLPAVHVRMNLYGKHFTTTYQLYAQFNNGLQIQTSRGIQQISAISFYTPK